MATVKEYVLTQCDKCRKPVYPDNVFREVPVPQQHGFVALVYKCSHCSTVGKMASTYQEWEELSGNYELMRYEVDEENSALIREFQFDLDQEITVEFLEEVFASYGPAKVLEVRNHCNCKECRERRERVL